MPSFNRLAVYGHRGWASSAIVKALAKSGAPLKVLHRPGSDVSSLPAGITSISVEVDDTLAVVAALHDVDILISLVGHAGVDRQLDLVKAIPKSPVKLFVPSDLGFLCNEEASKIPVLKAKMNVVQAAKNAGIPTTLILPSSYAESCLSIPILGVNINKNSIVYTGDSKNQFANICTREYVAAAYASLFSRTPLSQLQNRAIGLSELRVTGGEIAAALKKKNGKPPQILIQSLDDADKQIDYCVKHGIPLSLAWYCRKLWGQGKLVELTGRDIFNVPGYNKTTLEELLIEGKLESYRDLPESVYNMFDAMSEKAASI